MSAPTDCPSGTPDNSNPARSEARPIRFPGDVRIGPIVAAPAVLSELGFDPEPIFRRAGVNIQMFNNPETRLPLEVLGRLFLEATTETNNEGFGLLVGARFSLEGFGPLGMLMRHSTTVGEALRALLLNLHYYDRGAVPILLKLDCDNVLLGYSIYSHNIPGIRYAYDTAIAIALRILLELCGPLWKPVRVQFSHDRPKKIAPYRRLFGSTLDFDAEVSGIAFSSFWLDQAMPDADPVLARTIATDIRQAQTSKGMSFGDEVRASMHQMILGSTAAAINIAALFGIHERTLRKRLTAEGTSFQKILNQNRFELARQLLKNSRLPISEIAATLGYADSAVFSRAFRGWAKLSPREWRELG